MTAVPASDLMPTLTRRRLLVAGATTAAGAWAAHRLGWIGGEPPMAALARGPQLSIGYLAGTAGAAWAAGDRVVPATGLPHGDGALEGGTARVRISGTTPGVEAASMPAVWLDAIVTAVDDSAGTLLPFYAWSMRAGSTANPVAFTTAVRSDPGMGFAMGVGERTASAVFTTGRDAGRPRLRAGTYLIGLDPDTWARARTLPELGSGAWSALRSIVMTVAPA